MKRLLFGLVAVAAILGCGTDPSDGPTAPLLPPNDSPANALARFVATYRERAHDEYAALLTEDFRFYFSSDVDGSLASQWPDGYANTDEDTSALHLMQGGTTMGGTDIPAASTVDLTLHIVAAEPDTSEGRDPAQFMVLTAQADLHVVVPPYGSLPDPTEFVVEDALHRYYFVRGDAASLASGLPADESHWYLWKWEDATTLDHARRGPELTTAGAAHHTATWGRVKNYYR